ncbi:hypothetical protein FLPS103535_08995 [Flavobacterium psychrophilum]
MFFSNGTKILKNISEKLFFTVLNRILYLIYKDLYHKLHLKNIFVCVFEHSDDKIIYSI